MKQRILHYMREFRARWILLVCMLVVIGANLAAGAYLRTRPELVERVFVPIAKTVSSGMRAVANAVPFSITEAVACVLVLLIGGSVLALLIGGIRALVRRMCARGAEKATPAQSGEDSAAQREESESGRGELLRTVVTLSVAAAVLLSYFNIAYGFVFSRPTMFELLSLEQRGHTAEELYEVCVYLSQQAADARNALPAGSNPAAFDFDFEELRDASTEAFADLQQREPVFAGMIAKPKEVHFSKAMSYMGIAGMYAPFFSESSISGDGIAASIPFTITHEMAHGVMVGREDEANFAAFLATTGAKDAFVRYSGYYRAFMYCTNALYQADEELYRQVIKNTNEDVLRDRAIESVHVRSYEGVTTAVSEKFNDTFIKATGQEHGIESYGRVVDLILAWYDRYGY